MLKLGDFLIKALNMADIRWMIWKGSYHYKDGLEGVGDIDLLVHVEDKTEVMNILTDNGFLHFKTQKFMERKNVEDWIGLDAATQKFMHIHLHYSMVLGRPYVWEYSFKPYEQCFRSSQTVENGIRIQNPCWEYVLFLCRMRKEKVSKEKVKSSLSYFKGTISSDGLKAILGMDCSDKSIERLFELLQSEQFERDVLLVDDILGNFLQLEISNSRVRSIGRNIQARISRRLATL